MSNHIIVSEYEGSPVSFNEEGWFNATIVAERFGKRPIDWLSQDGTKEYINALSEVLQSEPKSLWKSKRGGSPGNAGTWMHPKLGIPFARWLDVKFGVWCDTQIYDILTGKSSHHDKKRVRHMAAASYKLMCEMLQDARLEEGKDTSWFNYANEAKLVNFVISGRYEGLDRETLTLNELDLLAKLEVKNTLLIAKRAERDERREVLCNVATEFWRNKTPLLSANDSTNQSAA